ncbi:PspA/IM30 family protein [Sphingomonas arenae]|uniref:PspA/IM30 family protein n=1 Tax=Sphingomonas arenae TaxID=2812555 RepID=UPI0019682669|nr:PspA/IM30 family protein [Sphingomonas arenae]
MAESVFLRVRRILSGRIEDTVDQMERNGGDGVMREAIREVDRAIDEIRSQQQSAMARRLQAAKQQKMVEAKIAELGEKARFAVNEGRDDLAEAALVRQVDFEAEIGKLVKVQESTGEEQAKLEDSLASLRSRKTQMEDALRAFGEAQAEASMGGDKGFQVQRQVEQKVERAEAAFDRAMGGAGGVNFTRADADTINKVTELDGLQKNASVQQRLAALKAGKAA